MRERSKCCVTFSTSVLTRKEMSRKGRATLAGFIN